MDPNEREGGNRRDGLPQTQEIPEVANDYEVSEEEDEEEDAAARDIEREMRGEAVYDEDERQAEDDGEDLMEDADGFVGGIADAERERRIFEDLGVDPDQYDADYIDDKEYDDISPRRRRAIEDLLDYRDYKDGRRRGSLRGRGGRVTDDTWRRIIDEDDDEEERMRLIEERVQRRRKFQGVGVGVEAPDVSNLEAAEAALRMNARDTPFDERIQEAVDICFRFFLYKFSMQEIDEDDEDNSLLYMQKLQKMVLDESISLYVSATHLFRFHCATLLKWIEHKPLKVLEVMNDTVAVEVRQQNPELFAKLYKNHSFKVIITEWPYTTELRSLRCLDLNSMIRFSGVVTRRGGVFPKLKVMYLTCASCGVTLSEHPVYFVDGQKPELPRRCLNCQGTTFNINRLKTVYTDFQRLTIQESPGTVPAGRAAIQKELIITGELVDKVKPGEEVEALGIYKTKYDTGLNIKNGFPVLATEIEVNNIMRKEDIRFEELTEEDVSEIQALSRDPNIRHRIIASIAPSIWGHKDLKTALAYALFGGVGKGRKPAVDALDVSAALQHAKNAARGGHTIRGDINVLLLGDPGLGKSQALQYVHKTYPRTVFTNGKGASAAGLTAGVRREPSTGEWTLEGGALVLADEGICLIDEFDKMTEKDRVSIHEAMEQQTISISKAGINTTLRARCAVIAAANPKHGGRYEASYTFKENLDLSDPILSRFDLIIVMRDIPNVDEDYYLAQYVVTNHQLNHPDIGHAENFENRIKELQDALHGSQVYQPINQALLQKYIIFARTRCKPSLDDVSHGEIHDKLTNFYSKIRQRTADSGGFPMTLRHIESLIRIAEANAKMRLAHRVSSRDVDYAIATMLDSFVQGQKHAVANRLSKEFARYRSLARGGYDMLVEIVRRSIQFDLERRNMKKLIEGDVRGGKGFNDHAHIAESDEFKEEEEEGSSVRLSFDKFLQNAAQNKFSRYHVDSWLQSDSFKRSFLLHKGENEKLFILCKNFVPRNISAAS